MTAPDESALRAELTPIIDSYIAVDPAVLPRWKTALTKMEEEGSTLETVAKGVAGWWGGGLLGSVGGGAAGVAGGAAVGAAVGTFVVPVVGTALGAVVGGVLGGGLGSTVGGVGGAVTGAYVGASDGMEDSDLDDAVATQRGAADAPPGPAPS